jgi:hypothetical protein
MAWWTQNNWTQNLHAEKKPNWQKRWRSYFPHGSVTDDTSWFQQTNDTALNTNWMPTGENTLEQARLTDVWNAMPTAWRNDIATWDDEWRMAYLRARSYGRGGVNFNGKVTSGEIAADEISKMYTEYKTKRDQQRQGTAASLDWRIA